MYLLFFNLYYYYYFLPCFKTLPYTEFFELKKFLLHLVIMLKWFTPNLEIKRLTRENVVKDEIQVFMAYIIKNSNGVKFKSLVKIVSYAGGRGRKNRFPNKGK